MISFYPEPKGYDCISSTWIFKEKMNLEGKQKFCRWVLEFYQRSKLSIGTKWKASGPFHKSKREFFLCDLREDAKQKNYKKFPFGKETSVASYYLARITSAITSVFRSPIVFASEVHVEPFQYVRVCKPTSFKSRCSFALINRKSGIVSIVFQVSSDQASGVVEFYFQSSVLSLSHPSRVDVDRRLPITTTSFPFYIPIWWTRSCGEIKIHDFEGFHQKRNVSVIIQFRYSRNLNPRCDLRFQVLLNCFPTPRSPSPEGIN